MTLLEPAYLLAAGALALPLLIHLLTRPRLREREFPLLFLIGPKGRARRFFRFPKDRVLLALRMCLVVLGALVLARPSCDALHGAQGAVAIVLDCSASMAAVGPDGSVIEAGKRAVVSLLGSFAPGSDVVLVRVPAGDSGPIRGSTDAEKFMLEGTAAKPLGTTTWDLIDAGVAALSQGSQPSGDLWVVSDFCGPSGTTSTLRQRLDGVRVHFVPIEGPRCNPHIREVRLGGGTPVPGAPVRLEAELRDVQAPLEIVLRSPDGEERKRTVGSAGAHQTVSWLLSAGTTSFLTATLLLPESPLSLDDTVYVSWQPVLQRRVLLVTDGVQPEAWVVAKALDPEGPARPWTVRQLEQHLVDKHEWEWADAVVWLASAEPRAREPQRGVLRFMGERAASSGDADGEPFRSEHAPVAIGRVSYGHPVFQVFTRTARGRMDPPLFFSHHRLRVPPERVVAYFADGWPAVVESEQGITVTAGLSDRETDWTIRGSFLPFLWEALSFLSGGPHRVMHTVGEHVRRGLRGGGAVQIVAPRGQSTALRPGADSTVSFVPEEPGFYRILREGAQVDVIAANVDPQESDLTPVDVSVIRRHLERAGARVGGRGGEWWHLVFGCLVMLLAFETVMSAPR